MTASQLFTACVLLALALPAASAQPSPARRTPFTHFGSEAAIELRGNGASAEVGFGNRADELVTRATLHLRYTYSLALAPGASRVLVAVNDEAIGTLPVTALQAGTEVLRALEVDPRLIVGFNKVTLTLVAAEGATPVDITRPGLWAEVSGASEFEITYQALAVADDLAILPEPFFDKRDQRRVTIPFAFTAHPSTATLNAAAIVASWFGQLATWRGARFPASLEVAPAGHAIAFATNTERPAFLASLPHAAGPELRMMTNPSDARSKLLVVMGRDGTELRSAAEALVGAGKMAGATMKVAASAVPPALAAYEAPAFVALDRPVRLAEVLEWPRQLETSGKAPELPPVKVDVRVPPDLAAWRGPGVPMLLKVRYGPAPCMTDARLEVGLNGDAMRVVALRAANEVITEEHEIHVPAYRLNARMRFQFAFRFTPSTQGACRVASPTIKASVSPESAIDFSGLPHFARMPNLNHFAAVGYPFTKYADLSHTVVVLPERTVAADIETMLALMARMGEATGHPATRVRVATARDEAQLADADLLVVGATPQHALLVKWAAELPAAPAGFARRSGEEQPRPAGPWRRVSDWLGLGAPIDASVGAQVNLEGGPLAAVFGFESPVTSGRSVVAVTAVSPHQVPRVLEALEDREQRDAMRGNAAFVLPGKVESVLVGRTYTVGFMPPWTGAGYWLMDHPAVASVLAAFTLGLLVILGWLARQRVAASRAQRRPA